MNRNRPEENELFILNDNFLIFMAMLKWVSMGIAFYYFCAMSAAIPAKEKVVVSHDSFLECEMCKMAVQVVVPMLGGDVEDIKSAVDAECKKEFKSVPFGTQECKKFIDEKLDPIIHELENGTAPKDVCTKLSMC
ncbi:unnamed protein product [Caenorhabditis auriculariae]|uniref:Saposin B-type domain-containing protein n=1 Tax=Caenorhabditis auriculariae TaxID=2777116 RepID=A0A8S1HC29_9PELO|nr:unnamed protein product [Caenorhabditis auriculariae]